MTAYVPDSARAYTETAVRKALAQLDGTPAAAVSLLTDTPADQLSEYGSIPDQYTGGAA